MKKNETLFNDIFEKEESTLLDRTLLYLFPDLELIGSQYERVWKQNYHQAFNSRLKIVLCFLCFGLLFQIFIDQQLGLEPLELFISARLLTIFSFILTFFTMSLRFIDDSKFYKLPVIVSSIVFCSLQFELGILDQLVPKISPFILISVAVIVIDLSPGTILVTGTLYFLAFSNRIELFMESYNDNLFGALSFWVTFSVIAILVQSRKLNEIRNFLLHQELNTANQNRVKMEQELNEQTRAFLPAEIYSRILRESKESRTSIVAATDEVLRPKNKEICCLFSDIRNYTSSSLNIDDYLASSVVPNTKLMTRICEKNRGITRLIGDLVLTYFDQDEEANNLPSAWNTAVEMSRANYEFNLRADAPIDRYIILSKGPAVVGNIGGTNSGREITALGPCVNVLERIDRVTKEERFQEIVPFDSILMTEDFAEQIRSRSNTIEFKFVDLDAEGMAVQDFETITKIWFLEPEHSPREQGRVS